MSPVFNDKFDALMHRKRQDETVFIGSPSTTPTTPPTVTVTPPVTTPDTPSTVPPPSPTPSGSNTISNTPTPSTTAPPTTTSAPPTTTSAPPTTTTPSTTSQPPTSTSSTVPITTSSTSSVISTSTIPTSTSISTTSALPTSTSAVVTSTAPTTAPTSTAASLTSRTLPTVSPSVIRTTSNGQVITVTAVVGATDTASTESSAGKPFFKNTGAVVGVFVVVGIVAAALLFVLATMFLRRRRAKKFDREVQEAAREAAHTQPAIDDDDDYAGATSYNTHSSQPMNTERPGGYGGYGAAASSWDPYGRAAAAGGTGYEMQHRRTSTGTGAGPGIAGFATGDVFARNAAPEPQGYNNQGYGQGYAQDSYNTGYGQNYGNQQYNNQAYNTSPPQGYALAQPQTQAGRAPVQAQMMMPEAQRHSYNNVGAFRQSPSYGEAHPGEQVEYGHAVQQDDDPYGGYEPYEAGPSQAQSQGHASNPPAYAVGASGTAGATGDRKGGHMARQPSASGRSGATRYSDDEDDVEPPRRVLKVANE